MADHNHTEADPKQVENAQEMWHKFTAAGKYSIYATAILLILLAIGFVDFSS